MSLSTVDIDAPQTDVAEPDTAPETVGAPETGPTSIEQVTSDAPKRRLPVPARKRVAHRIIASVITQAEDSGGFDHALEAYTTEDAQAIREIIDALAEDHNRRSL